MSIITLFLTPIPSRARAAAIFVLSVFLLPVIPARAFPAGARGDDDFIRSRREMVERDLRRRGIKEPAVLGAMESVPRHLFVGEKERPFAYEDHPLPIGEGQTISQPYIVALMTELAQLKGDEKVLEVGTGSGYQAAVLSRLAREVYTIEILPALAAKAKRTLAQLGYGNVQIKTGDGFFGWEDKGPFDVILVTAAAEEIPERLWQQLRDGGRLVMPLGGRQNQKLVRATRLGAKREVEEITGVVFVPMTGAIREKGR